MCRRVSAPRLIETFDPDIPSPPAFDRYLASLCAPPGVGLLSGAPAERVARSGWCVSEMPMKSDGIVRWRNLTDNYRLRPSAADVPAAVVVLGEQ